MGKDCLSDTLSFFELNKISLTSAPWEHEKYVMFLIFFK